MAKNVAKSKWNGYVVSYWGAILKMILAIAITVGGGFAAGVAMGAFEEGGPLYLLIVAVAIIVAVGLFGLCWAAVIYVKFNAKYSVVDGQNLKVKGNALGLYLNTLKWVLLTIVTLGLYLFWIPVAFRKWVLKHTVSYVEETEEVVEEVVVDEDQPQITYYTVEE